MKTTWDDERRQMAASYVSECAGRNLQRAPTSRSGAVALTKAVALLTSSEPRIDFCHALTALNFGGDDMLDAAEAIDAGKRPTGAFLARLLREKADAESDRERKKGVGDAGFADGMVFAINHVIDLLGGTLDPARVLHDDDLRAAYRQKWINVLTALQLDAGEFDAVGEIEALRGALAGALDAADIGSALDGWTMGLRKRFRLGEPERRR